jgi:hypothetical protein
MHGIKRLLGAALCLFGTLAENAGQPLAVIINRPVTLLHGFDEVHGNFGQIALEGAVALAGVGCLDLGQ